MSWLKVSHPANGIAVKVPRSPTGVTDLMVDAVSDLVRERKHARAQASSRFAPRSWTSTPTSSPESERCS